MSSIPPILIRLEADVANLKAGLAQAEAGIKGIDDNVKTAGKGMGNFTTTLKKVGAAMGLAFAGTQLATFAKDSIMAASDMNESISKVAVVFGDTADEVYKFGESAAKSMGMSNQEALEAAGTYGNLFQALGVTKEKSQDMSLSMVQLAADLGSFNNMSTTDSLNALRSGLSGETEPLKRFGIALNDVTLKNKAMEMGFGKIKGVMDPAIKAQVTYALVMEQTTKAQGDYARTSLGTANSMKTLSAQFADAKVAVGNALLPVFNLLLKAVGNLIPLLASTAKFINENKNAIATFAVVLGVGAAAYGVYELMTKRAIIQEKIMQALQKLNPIMLIVTAVALLAAGMVVLFNKNESFRKIVINIAQVAVKGFAFIISTVGLLVTGIMKLVTGPMRLLLKGLDMLGVAGAGDALKEINGAIDKTGAFFKSAAAKVNEFGASLDKYNKIKPKPIDKSVVNLTPPTIPTTGGGADTTAADKAAKALENRKEKIQAFVDKAHEIYEDMYQTMADAEEDYAEATAKRDEAIFEAKADHAQRVIDLNAMYLEQMAQATENHEQDYADARKNNAKELINIAKDYSKQVADIESKYREKVKDLQDKASEDLADLENKTQDKIKDLKEKAAEKIIDLEEKTQSKIKDLKEKAAEKLLDVEEKYQAKVADLRSKAEEKSNDLIKKAAEKRQSIVQQSMDRLRDAFASKTGFDLSKAFESSGSVSGLLDDLKAKLQGAKDLQQNAAALAGMGYSQVFIEEVVKNGPEAGNAIAQALRGASPEATAELQSLYNQVDTISAHGLDTLATTMNAGANLATEELRAAYSQVGLDLQESLATVAADLSTTLSGLRADHAKTMADISDSLAKDTAKILEDQSKALADIAKTLTKETEKVLADQVTATAEINKTLQKALADAAKDFSKAMADAAKERDERIAEAAEKLAEALADADEALKKAQEKAAAALAKGLADADKDLTDKLAATAKAFDDAIAKIEKDTNERIAKMKAAIAEVAEALLALGAKKEALDVLKNAPVYVPTAGYSVAAGVAKTGALSAAEYLRESGGGNNITINAPITNNNTTSDADIGNTIVSIAKYGLVVAG
jgi:hypothetical protein